MTDAKIRTLTKENNLLKQIIKEKKAVSNETVQGLIDLIDLQRDKITSLEEGTKLLQVENKELTLVKAELKKRLIQSEEIYQTDLTLKTATKFDERVYVDRIEFLENCLRENAIKYSKELSKYNKTITERFFLGAPETKTVKVKSLSVMREVPI